MPTAPINMQPSSSIESSKISRSRLDPGGVTLNINAHSTALFAYQVLRNSSGSLAIFAAIRRALSRVSNVRFTPKSGHRNSVVECPLCAKSGHMQCSKRVLFDHLVGEHEEIVRHFETESLGGFEINDQ